MAKWVEVRKAGNFEEIGRRNRISPVLARLLRNRGIEEDADIQAYLHGGLELLHDPGLLKDMDLAGGILAEAIEERRRIRVIGDYDVDGVCAAAILVRGLRQLGAVVDAVIPHRVRDGYGMNMDMIERAHEDGVDVLLTCDNGISAREEVARAAEYGITVIVTDHHEVPFEDTPEGRHYLLPEADAVVDPKQPDCPYPFNGICGAFVAFKLIIYLYEEIMQGEMDVHFREELLQLAAFATIEDIMDLQEENRPLVKRGLELLNTTPVRGIRELIAVLGLGEKRINAYHVGFLLGPCINASGRMDTAERALQLLLTEDVGEAQRIAGELQVLNEERKTMTEQAAEAAFAQIEEQYAQDKVYVVYLPECHESIAGIVAGRVKERYGHPALVITNAEDGLKGSARSITAYHMYEGLTEVADVFTRFGGHAQAAGFSLPADRLEELRRRLNENCRLQDKDFGEVLRIDLNLPLQYANEALLRELELLEPTGQGNRRPLFGRSGLTLTGLDFYGANDIVCKLYTQDQGQQFELTMFRRSQEIRDAITKKYGEETVNRLRARGAEIPIVVVYTIKEDTYHGGGSVQIIVDDYKI
ncbi:MAG: single-stranded-DNA-specific exonuclease RecJ [Lachnospiraceae bacterium]|nr:single-stranded-DNA-specific exonuclease RecJ [Lachnospiraceae bacterium]